jgi:membrane protease subunit HflK
VHSEETGIRPALRETFGRLAAFSRWIAAALILLYLLSGVYSISPNEIGVLQRFGKVLDDRVPSGIHYALPWPVDRVTKVPIRIVNSLLVDDFYNSFDIGSAARAFYKMTGLASYCISGDNNLVNVKCVIQYNITDPLQYLFRVKEPEQMLRSMACNTIIHCMARMPVDEILTRGKQTIANYVKEELQQRLDDAETGVGVSFVELRDIKPPDRVQRFFSDVVNAQIDREKMINDAESYRNEQIPAAQAEAARVLEEAAAYRAEVVLRAEGEADRFRRILNRARERGDSARRMLHVETMKKIMKSVDKKHLVGTKEDGQAPARLRFYSPPL